MRKFISSFLQVVGLLSILSVFLSGLGLYFIGNWLFVNEELVKSDAIVLLAGAYSRPRYGADLFKKGYAPQIYISRPWRSKQALDLEKLGINLQRQEEIYKEILLKKNVPEKDIRFFGKSNFSTVEEAESLKKIFGDKRVRLLLVTTPFHTRRVKAIFGDILPNAEIRVVASPYEEFTQKWWTHRGSAINVILEAIKTFYYHIGGAKRSSDNSPIKSVRGVP